MPSRKHLPPSKLEPELRSPTSEKTQSSVLIEPLAFLMGSLILGIVFWSIGNVDPMWAIIAFILVYEPDARMAAPAAITRLVSTILGSLLAMGAVLAFSVQKWTLPLSIFLVSLLCSTLRSSRPVRRILLVTVALIIGSSFLETSSASYIAVTRSVEVAIGGLLAIAFSWLVPRMERG